MFVDSLGFTTWKITLSTNKHNFISPTAICIAFASFSRPIALDRTSGAMLTGSGENRHPSLFLISREKHAVLPH